MRKLIYSCLSLFLISFGAEAQNQNWARTSESNGESDDAYSVDMDNAGNRYVAGVYSRTLRIDGVDYPNDTSDNTRDAFIIKYDHDGNVQWVQTITGTSHQEIRCIKVNKVTGEVYVSGIFYYDFFIDGVQQNSLTYTAFPGSFHRTFIAKFDTDGNFMWSNNTYSIAGYTIDGGYSLALSPAGNYVYFHSGFIGDLNFEGGPTITAVGFGAQNMLLAKFNTTTGNPDAIRSDIERYLFYGKLLATDRLGNVYYAGTHSTSCMAALDPVFNPCLPNPSTNEQGFVWKMDANFNSIWGKEISGVGFEKVEAIATDYSNNVYMYGTFTDVADFDGNILNPVAGKYNGFVAKLNASGAYQYIKQFDMDMQYTSLFPNDMEVAFAVDRQGNTFFGGGFAGTFQMDGETMTSVAYPSPHYCEGYLVKLNKNGDLRWMSQYTGNAGAFDKTWIHGLSANANFITVGGHMVGTNVYAGDTITSDLDSYFLSSIQDCDVRTTITTTATAVNIASPATLTAPVLPGATYQWTRNNAIIAGATANTHIAYVFGNYRCVITYGECVLTSNRLQLTVLPRLGTATAQSVLLFPNPNTGDFHLQLESSTVPNTMELHITDLTGRMVYQELVSSTDGTLHIQLPAEISSGTYYVNLTTDQFQQTIPMIIE